MVKHTFFDKCCTIVKDTKNNTGLNPVAELTYGDRISRALIHFDINELISMYENKEIIDLSKIKHILKLTNCGSINNDIHANLIDKVRASSFDVILFKVPKPWDNGKGVDFKSDMWQDGSEIISMEGCNWYQCSNGNKWEEEGIYSPSRLSHEYDAFSEGKESVIIARQHFDIGNENFEFDITEYINNIILKKEENFGLCLAFTPKCEMTLLSTNQYIGFFGPNTHTFFQPYLETIYGDLIIDDRNEFYLDKTNRLFLYCHDEGEFFNLDEMPIFKIEGLDIMPEVKQLKKGVYYVEFSIKTGDIIPDTILYDKWSNLTYNGVKLGDEEFEFVVLESKSLFQHKTLKNSTYIPSVFGINHDETLEFGEKRRINLCFRKKYSTNEYKVVKNASYRIYIKDGDKEINVINYQPINKTFLENYFDIDTNNLLPNKYYVDIKHGDNVYKDILRFKIADNITNRYI